MSSHRRFEEAHCKIRVIDDDRSWGMNTPEDFPEQSDDAIRSAYRDAASEHGRLSAQGNHVDANAQAGVLAGAYLELRSRGTESQRYILELLDDEDESVRSWASAHALEFAPGQAEAVLAAVADGRTVAAFDARMTLREWRAGRLSFP